MWRSVPSRSFFRTLLSPAVDVIFLRQAGNPIVARAHPRSHSSSAAASPEHVSDAGEGEPITGAEAWRLMRLVNVEALKRRLGAMGGAEVIGYAELLKECEAAGVARSREEAAALARALDEAGVVLLFRDKVYLHPDKIVDLVRSSVPLVLTPKDDPRREELKQLFKKKEEIDRLAHKQVRRILWSGLGLYIGQIGLFFRLTFWEFSWDIMEPIAFFGTMTGLLVGYAYFIITSRDPTYQDFMERLFSSRQRKLSQKLNFDMERFMELQKHCKLPFNHHMGGTGLHEVHRD